eukprot:8491179-Pyramimonas_sp.AAC.1
MLLPCSSTTVVDNFYYNYTVRLLQQILRSVLQDLSTTTATTGRLQCCHVKYNPTTGFARYQNATSIILEHHCCNTSVAALCYDYCSITTTSLQYSEAAV